MIKATIFDLNGIFIKSRKLGDRFEKDFNVPPSVFLPKLFEIMGKIRKPNAGSAFSYWEPCLKKWNINFTEKEFWDYWFKSEIPSEKMIAFAKKLKENREDLAKTITDEVGKPIMFSKIEVDRCIETVTLSAEVMRTMHGETINTDAMNSGKKTMAFFSRVPSGVVVAITPFNFPLNLVAHKLAPALVAGNAVVLKPTPEAPLTAYKFAKLFIESEFAIKDALSVVYGDAEVGNALVTSDIPRVISFTGSVTVGNIITKNAGIKKVSLELGGNAATFIDKSADLELAAARCAIDKSASLFNASM